MEDIRDDIQENSKSLTTTGIDEFNALKGTQVIDVVRAVQNKKTMELAETDETVRAQMEENAKHSIDDSMKVVANESATKVNESHFDLHKTANKMYGFKEARPLWQQKMMVVGSAIWFIIYFIIATFTVCPISVFCDVFKNIFKNACIAIIVSILVYLAIIVGIPLLTKIRV